MRYYASLNTDSGVSEQLIMQAATHFSSQPVQQAKMNQLLCNWDLGLSGIDLKIIQPNPVEAPDQTSWFP
jgi:hypothetical protein